LGHRLTGKVRRTYLRGECVFDNGDFPRKAAGREYDLRR